MVSLEYCAKRLTTYTFYTWILSYFFLQNIIYETIVEKINNEMTMVGIQK